MAWCWIRQNTRQIHPGQFFPGRTPRSSSTGMYGRRSKGRAQSMMKLRSRHQCDTPVVRPCSPSVASRALIYRSSNTSVNMGAFRVLKIMKLCNIFLLKTNQRRAIAILLSKQFCYKKKKKNRQDPSYVLNLGLRTNQTTAGTAQSQSCKTCTLSYDSV